MPDNLDSGVRFVETEVRPMLASIEGYCGLSVLIDRGMGECIATSSWESEEAMKASAGQVDPIRQRASQVFGGSMMMDEWEIALMHREHRTMDGSCCRVMWASCDPGMIDEAMQAMRDALPQIEQLSGFCSMSVMLDRGTGLACVTATYDTRDAMEANRPMADQIQAATSDAAGAKMLEVKEYELAMAHLNVPEMV
jgi:hypothetical protein